MADNLAYVPHAYCDCGGEPWGYPCPNGCHDDDLFSEETAAHLTAVTTVLEIISAQGWLSDEEDYSYGEGGAEPYHPDLRDHDIRPVAERIVAALLPSLTEPSQEDS